MVVVADSMVAVVASTVVAAVIAKEQGLKHVGRRMILSAAHHLLEQFYTAGEGGLCSE